MNARRINNIFSSFLNGLLLCFATSGAGERASIEQDRKDNTTPKKALSTGFNSVNADSVDTRRYFTCGQNALYLYLQLLGHESASLKDVKAEVPVSVPKGSTLADMLRAARKFGVNAEVRIYGKKDFGRIPVPAILHMRRGRSTALLGHYSVLYGRDRSNVYLIDGTTGETYVQSKTTFDRSAWSGYALTVERSRYRRLMNTSGPLLGALVLMMGVMSITYWARRGESGRWNLKT